MRAHRLITLALALVLAALAVAPSPALADARQEIKDFLRQYNGRYELGDVPGLMALVAKEPDVVSIGSGPGEFFKGRQAIQTALTLAMAMVKGVSFKFGDDMVISPRQDVAWLAANCFVQVEMRDGSVVRSPARITAVLVREDGGWKLYQAHTSLASPKFPYFPAGK